MNKHLPHVVACILAGLLISGCGGGDPPVESGGDDAVNPEAPPPGEIVAQASEKTLMIVDQELVLRDIAAEVLADPGVKLPEGYSAALDKEYAHETRLRTVVEPTGSKQDDETVKAAADEAFEAYALQFSMRVRRALREAEAGLVTELQETAGKTETARSALRAYQAARRGLPETTESRQEQRRLELAFEKLLDKQIELNKQITAVQRVLDRERWPVLQRIR